MTSLVDFLLKYCKWIYTGCLILNILLCVDLINTVPDKGVVPVLAFVAVFPVIIGMLYFQTAAAVIGFLCIKHKKVTGFLLAANILILIISLVFLRIFF